MSYVEIPLVRLPLALGFVLLALVISRRTSLGLERDLLWGALRAIVQLLAVGAVLALLFARERLILTLAALAVMLGVAAITSARRVEHSPGTRNLIVDALRAVAIGGALTLVPTFLVIVRPTPFYDARYWIPIAGMVLSAAMNTVAQVFERVFAAASADPDTIEQLLALGARPDQALHGPERAAVRASMIPVLNMLFTMGLVSLPGMMTGQIVAGVSPQQAVRYQVVVMFQLLAVTAVSGTLAARRARKLLFTPRAQLIRYPIRPR
jgi:putative ABC transport system permease protein